MFYNILKRAALNRSCSFSRYTQIQRNFSAERKHEKTAPNLSATKAADEIEDALTIEANLFENSSLQHKPALARELIERNTLRKPHMNAARMSKGNMPNTTKTVIRSETIDDPELGLQFVRLNQHDPMLNHLLTTARSRKYRDKSHQIIVDGRRLISEALQCRLPLQALIFSRVEQLKLLKDEIAEAQRTQQTKVYKVPQHNLKMWSTLSTPPGILGIFGRPSPKCLLQQMSKGSTPLSITVVCDNIREPNNLGSIIRTCAAIPCAQVIVTRGCCDPWESKALRGGCGGQFRLPVHDDVEWESLPLFIPANSADDCYVFVAENNLDKVEVQTQAVNYADVEKTGAHNVVVIGGESHGVSKDAYKFLATVGKRGKCIYIPLADGIDSLNVTSALTLILYELRKKSLSQTVEHLM